MLEKAKAAYTRGNYASALRLYQPIADRGSANAQLQLGHMYSKGQGVPKNYVEAYKWYSIAASRLPALHVMHRHLEAVKAHDLAANLITPAQIAEAQRLASRWKPNATPPSGFWQRLIGK